MKNKLSPREKDLYRRTDEILHYIWDPIGVKDTAQARDEYHAYLPRIFKRVLENHTDHEIANLLMEIETKEIGLTSEKAKSLEVGKILIDATKWIFDEAP